jgi:hypothetical protein
VLAGSVVDIVRNVLLRWLVGAFSVLGVVIVWVTAKNR